MKKVEIKTKETEKSVQDFLQNIENEEKREDCKKMYQVFSEITKEEGKLWGDTIVGFVNYEAMGASRCVDWFKAGFSPRKNYISLYFANAFYNEDMTELAQKLGKVKLGKGCINFNKLNDLDENVLKELIRKSIN